ncbi:hypothetical protein OHC33_009954 [Knufia fluminis]|uniref:FAD-binding FR-type domain-containing protein n=1 Tax=Knufia fluminis TaxID=191047 RepID=A0AAN8EP11_9EURO|nr:hypothetical protein OHC33_009954 [Knufia fluminis]
MAGTTFTTISTHFPRLARGLFQAKNITLHSNAQSLDNGATNNTSTDYSTGLAGVNLAMDQTVTKILLASMFVVALVVLAIRVVHLFQAHIRHIHCIHSNKDEQNYWAYDRVWWLPWLKREIIYAPLGKKRHNREWQLGKAQNYGTLPGRAHTVLLVLYVLSNFIYSTLLPYRQQETAKTIAELRGRTGVLAVVNMIPLVLLAGRNNPLIRPLKISFDTFNLFHRWIGRIVVLESIVHVCAWYANYSAKRGVDASFESFSGSLFLTSGLVAVLGMILMVVLSLSAVRHAFYEVFLHGHQILAFFAIAGVYVHIDVEHLPALPYIQMVVMAWGMERVLRLVWILYLNIGYRRRETTKVIIEALPGEACRVTFQLPRHTFIRPGSHVYAYLPKFSLWMSHPFSVAWTNPESEPPTGGMVLEHDDNSEASSLLNKETLDNAIEGSIAIAGMKSPNYLERQAPAPSYLSRRKTPPTSLSLVCAARTGMTRKIYEAALKAPARTIFTSGLIEGPYAGHDKLASYGTVVMFAGGAGITHHLVQIRHLLACAQNRTVATRRIILAWSVRDLESLTWVAPWMDEILKMPGRRDVLSMHLFVTKARGPADYVSPSRSIELKGERCNPGKVLDCVLRRPPSEGGRVGACFVSVCGPGAFADEVRRAVRERIGLGALDMNEESFTW